MSSVMNISAYLKLMHSCSLWQISLSVFICLGSSHSKPICKFVSTKYGCDENTNTQSLSCQINQLQNVFHHAHLASWNNQLSPDRLLINRLRCKNEMDHKHGWLLQKSLRSWVEWQNNHHTVSCYLLMWKPPVALWVTYQDVRPLQPPGTASPLCSPARGAGTSEIISRMAHRGHVVNRE